MLSDGAPCGVSVRRLHCRSCGVGWLPPFEAARLPRRTFGDAYALGAAPPTAADLARAGGYARRIAALWNKAPPATVLDVGCGNGALMAALGTLWPATRFRGVEPAPRVAAAARLGGNPVSRSLRPGMRASLVVSVNVIEHTPDPLGFLRSLRRAVAPGGAALLICPDGALPWLELLMADHRWSFTPAALAGLAAQAGFMVERNDPAPGGFQALALRPVSGRPTAPQRRAFMSPGPRRSYLGAWRALDGILDARSAGGGRRVCFGVGEVTRLLRMQAPKSWSRVAALTADDAAGAQGLGRPFLAPADLRPDDEVLLAVRPGAQPAVAARLGERHAVLRWDDVLAR
jgi:SAM-dependent methyltransferase